MSTFQVVAAQEVRRMPAKDQFPEKAVDHLTLSANGTQTLVTMFRKVGDPLPDIGSTLEGELGDPDRFDKDRRKFSRARQGGGFRQRNPAESRRIERQHAQHMSLLYIKAKLDAGLIKSFTFDQVQQMADAFDRDLEPAPAKDEAMPFDDQGLPPLNDIPDDGGDTPL
jgi:hypothetical protein